MRSIGSDQDLIQGRIVIGLEHPDFRSSVYQVWRDWESLPRSPQCWRQLHCLNAMDLVMRMLDKLVAASQDLSLG